eukprot:856143-Prorocentrum_minimum.AAC.1
MRPEACNRRYTRLSPLQSCHWRPPVDLRTGNARNTVSRPRTDQSEGKPSFQTHSHSVTFGTLM